ncbi:hypothetical protein CHUAL_006174 [Chamberlinius hualienensis]
MRDSVLIIGSAGREHALAWKLAQSEAIEQVYVCPGNEGTSFSYKIRNAVIDLHNHSKIAKWCRDYDIALVVVGPEDPLANGLADSLKHEGIRCFGPCKNAAEIESNKVFAKSFMDRNNIPTTRWKAFTNPKAAKDHILSAPYPALVIKANGLVGGKGVVIAETKEEAIKVVEQILTDRIYGSAGNVVVVEEKLSGEEISVFCFTDGETVALMPPAQDHKRLLNGSKGPNTGGMGAYSPYPLVGGHQMEWIRINILQATVNLLKKESRPYVGVLYAGLIMTSDGPKVLEYNCRFGDPETEVLMPLLESDLYPILMACVTKNLRSQKITWKLNTYTVGVVLASKGYPTHYTIDIPITGLNEVGNRPRHLIFHSGTKVIDDQLVTNSGRVLIVVVVGNELLSTMKRATEAARTIKFEGKQFRSDIGAKSVERLLSRKISLSYKSAGVDVNVGDNLMQTLKPICSKTVRSGVMGCIGGFGGLFDLKDTGFKDPILVSGTDGVGTKLKIAEIAGIHDTIGIDLVAMCVNDVLAHGAEPLFFLDYFACGKLHLDVATKVVEGVARGCKLAGCALIGGETAEMPGMYAPNTYDLAGFSVGAVERSHMLPRSETIVRNDVVIGLSSSGLHSNGFSLIRKIVEQTGLKYDGPAPFKTRRKLGEELLTPTKIYSKVLLPVIKCGFIKAFAHITGGGLINNISRVLPSSFGVRLNAANWEIPPVFGWVAAAGKVSDLDMLKTLNCGLGAVIIVAKENADKVIEMIHFVHENAWDIGRVIELKNGETQVLVSNFGHCLRQSFTEPVVIANGCVSEVKKVAVLISGNGTNLQALIDHTLNPIKQSPAKIVLVISNNSDAYGLHRAETSGIQNTVICHKNYSSRIEFDMAIHDALVKNEVDLVCLSGFMRILSGEFVCRWRGRLINIHPSLLPSFRGINAPQQALEAGVRITGCSIHYVTKEVDAGAILVQEAVPVWDDDTVEILHERIREAEHKAYPKALDLIASGKARLGENNKIVWKH